MTITTLMDNLAEFLRAAVKEYCTMQKTGEIPIEVYNKLKDSIKKQDEVISDLSKENSILKNDFNNLKAISLDLSNSSLYERMFKWNKLTQDIKAYGEKL